MTRLGRMAVFFVSLSALALAVRAAAQPAEADLATGIRMVKDGDFEAGLVTLDAVARNLAAQGRPSRDSAQAYLYMGVAYVGLGQDSLAKAKFRQALQLDRSLRLSPDEFPLRVIRTFEAAARSAAEVSTLQKQARRKKGKGGLILLGVGGVAAAGIAAVAVTSERANHPPTATMTITPEGQAITAVTTMTFTANASDPEGEPLSYAWAFGDGGSANGPTVTHVYAEPNQTFTVTLIARDGLSSTTVMGSVTARTLVGLWRVTSPAFLGIEGYRIDRTSQGSLEGVLQGPGFQVFASGSATDPRIVKLNAGQPGFPCTLAFAGEADASLDLLTGTFSCQGHPPCSCVKEQQPLALRRQ